ncbi:MAG: DUF1328 domain-containing protein [Candidatus Auribacterota bacterium]
MLAWSFTFLFFAIIGGIMSFTQFTAVPSGLGKALSVLFLILFVISLVMRAVRKKSAGSAH